MMEIHIDTQRRVDRYDQQTICGHTQLLEHVLGIEFQICEVIGLKRTTEVRVEISPLASIHSVSVRSYFAANFTLANYPLDI